MDNPGVYTLAAEGITTALVAKVEAPMTLLDGMTAVTLEANFAYGSGGITASCTVQTTLDGTNWRDIARFDFTTASRVAFSNISALLATSVVSYGALGSEGGIAGLLGNQLRAVVTTTGVYVNTTLTVRASVR